ncbi:MAG: dihydroorotate dehydrogenase electron transfer subunit, partial [Chloroflexota bacterium]
MARITSKDELMPDTWLIWVEAPAIAAAARPGQFVMVRCSDSYDPLLRRPLSIHRLAGKGPSSQIALLFEVVGKGTEWLACRKEGDNLNLLGPLGKGFSIPPTSHNLLLVAGGMGIAPLVALADRAVAEGRFVALLMGAKSKERLYPSSNLPLEIELDVATEDGSEGRMGMATDRLPDFLTWADQVYACGPVSMYHAIAALQPFPRRATQVLLESPMACGLGGCYGCVIATKHGLKRICKDGPRFDL